MPRLNRRRLREHAYRQAEEGIRVSLENARDAGRPLYLAPLRRVPVWGDEPEKGPLDTFLIPTGDIARLLGAVWVGPNLWSLSPEKEP